MELDIGKHCYECGQLDFLPFFCKLCVDEINLPIAY